MAALLCATPSLGDDIQVNTFTTSFQIFPAVASDADGDFVVVWQRRNADLSYSIQGQRYASDGSAVGGEFQVDSYTSGNQQSPSVASDADGDFVVVWHSDGSAGTDSSASSIQGQRYASDGSAIGGEFQVNSYTSSSQRFPAVAADADGDFVVVWHSNGSGGSDGSSYSIQGQRYASDGSAIGGQFQVNSYTSNGQRAASVALDADGDFVVVWSSNGSPGNDSDYSCQGQRYASDGSAIGGQFQVNSYTTNYQSYARVALDADGNFVVVWHSNGSAGNDSDYSIQGQRYAPDGSAVGGEFQVNSYTSSGQRDPEVALDANGDFVVVWQSNGSAGTDSDYSIQGQRYASDGSAIGDELQVNTYTSTFQRGPSVALDADGNFVVVWHSYGSGGTDSSYSSIQRSMAAPVPVELWRFSIE